MFLKRPPEACEFIVNTNSRVWRARCTPIPECRSCLLTHPNLFIKVSRDARVPSGAKTIFRYITGYCNVFLKFSDVQCFIIFFLDQTSSYKIGDAIFSDISRVNTSRPRKNGGHFADEIFKCIFLKENAWISIKISPKFVPNGPIKIIPELLQIMVWRRSGDKTIILTNAG